MKRIISWTRVSDLGSSPSSWRYNPWLSEYLSLRSPRFYFLLLYLYLADEDRIIILADFSEVLKSMIWIVTHTEAIFSITNLKDRTLVVCFVFNCFDAMMIKQHGGAWRAVDKTEYVLPWALLIKRLLLPLSIISF